MGGHGGLNILPQKRWNVYNYENREKVRQDEETAAREEQIKREQSRRRDAEFRLERLRQARGLQVSSTASCSEPDPGDSGHINLFEGLKDFSSLAGVSVSASEEGSRGGKRSGREDAEDTGSKSGKKRRREEAPVVPLPEDEKYKLGYGLIGKGVKAPWYALKSSFSLSEDVDEGSDGKRSSTSIANGCGKKSAGKKTIEELRNERIRREKKEKERERALLASLERKNNSRYFSRRI
ncbi:hypothetical protein AXF42_Ash005980 [Apostasia shenzhenica]|uniref:CBF1-interacting co-repressor CIR N-terminal domain-containing protein n=1 Tax=Apostasia shenzhenica TaxID=1088818 RepID=A0A2I0AZX1_9ASPA|nr:hypothetical protein AXF42_Ash005980 [Apostasia shenzhenica]